MTKQIETLRRAVTTLETRVSAVEYRQLRFMRVWIASQLTSSTSGPTASTSPISTANGPERKSLWLRILKFLPRLAGFLVEKAFQYLGPTLLSFGLATWAVLKGYGMEIWLWLVGFWHWLFG